MRNFLVAAGLVFSVVVLSGCSMRWADADGYEKYAGLLVYEITKTGNGTKVKRTTVGLDINFSGPQKGVMLGVRTTAERVPETIFFKTPKELGDGVTPHLKGIAPVPAPGEVETGWFFLKENFTPTARYIESDAVGLEWSQGESGGGLSLGYSGVSSYLGLHTESAEVLIRTKETKPPHRERFMRWMARE